MYALFSVCVCLCKGQFVSGLFLGELTFAWKEDRNSLSPGAELPENIHTHRDIDTNTRIVAYTSSKVRCEWILLS